MKNALDDVKDNYDYIIIDTPPSLGLLTLNALTAADTFLVPIQCEYYALEGLSQLLSTIKLVQKNLNPGLQMEGILLTIMITAPICPIRLWPMCGKISKKKYSKR